MCCCGEGDERTEMQNQRYLGGNNYEEEPENARGGNFNFRSQMLANNRYDDDESIQNIQKIQGLIRGFIDRNRHIKKNHKGEKRSQISRSLHSNRKNYQSYRYGDKIVTVENPQEKPSSFKDGVRRIFPTREVDLGTKNYEGEWINGKRDGFGVLKWKDGSIFKGFFVNDMANGLGKQHHKQGETYVGEWVNDRAEGIGHFTNTNGCTYQGEWVSDKQEGFGREVWTKGSTYEGTFINGMKHGYGTLTLEDGSFFEGEFKENTIDGLGRFKYFDGKEYNGEWRNNKMHGFGILSYTDGKRFEGKFEDDLKHGFGVYQNGPKTYVGVWNKNKLEGEVLTIENGKFKSSIWKAGKKTEALERESIFADIARKYDLK